MALQPFDQGCGYSLPAMLLVNRQVIDVNLAPPSFKLDQFTIPGQIVADIGLERPLLHHPDGSISIHIEALTISE